MFYFVERATDYPDNSVTSHLFSSGRRPDTAFQRYRNSRLGGEFHSEITGRSLSECLDECLRQTSFQCRYKKSPKQNIPHLLITHNSSNSYIIISHFSLLLTLPNPTDQQCIVIVFVHVA